MNKLTQQHLKRLLRYDPMTGFWFKLVGHKVGQRTGYLRRPKRSRPSWCIDVDGVKYTSSRLAWLYMIGSWPSGEVDHRDLDSLNDRWNNLRIATRAQNEVNKAAYRNNKLGLKGVRFQYGRYVAAICRGGQRKYLGSFNSAIEAHAAYLQAARVVDGEFFRAA